MALYVFNNAQELLGIIANDSLKSLVRTVEINASDVLESEVPNGKWSEFSEQPFYLAVKDLHNDNKFYMYKITDEATGVDFTSLTAIQVGFDELKSKGYIKDRRFVDDSFSTIIEPIVDGIDWDIGYVDSFSKLATMNFYYTSRLDALREVIDRFGCEVEFSVEVSGNSVVSKRINFYDKMSEFKGKRFTYGNNLIEVVKESNNSELYTALIGRGKGEESGDGYGRKLTFADVEWSVANGDPVDKPIGQEYVELPDMTSLYGYPDGEPRIGFVEFSDEEDASALLQATYDELINVSRPKVQLKASVADIGDVELGEEVAIIRKDIGIEYKTRIYKLAINYLDSLRTKVELGDKLTQSQASTIRTINKKIENTENSVVEFVQTTADGKNKIYRSETEPTDGMITNDLWYKPVGAGETELYRWTGEIWALEKVSAGLLGGTLDAGAGDLDVINLNASNISTGTLDALVVDVINLNADNIETGSLNAIDIFGVNITGSKITSTSTDYPPWTRTTEIDDGSLLVRANSLQGGVNYNNFFATQNGDIFLRQTGDGDGVSYDYSAKIEMDSGSILINTDRDTPSSYHPLKIKSPAGLLSIGVWGNQADFDTDASFGFYFQKTVRVNGNIETTGTGSFSGSYDNTTSSSPNVFIAPNGDLVRSTSASKYKVDMQAIETDFSRILSVQPKSWYDKAELERSDGETSKIWRHHGVIAEDLVDAGLDEFVIWENGEPEGVQYDRLAIYLIPIVKELSQRVEELERVIK